MRSIILSTISIFAGIVSSEHYDHNNEIIVGMTGNGSNGGGHSLMGYGNSAGPKFASNKEEESCMDNSYQSNKPNRSSSKSQTNSINTQPQDSTAVTGHHYISEDGIVVVRDTPKAIVRGQQRANLINVEDVTVLEDAIVKVTNCKKVRVYGNGQAILRGESRGEFHDNAKGILQGKAAALFFDSSIGEVHNEGHAITYDNTKVTFKNKSYGIALGKSKIFCFDTVQSNIYDQATAYCYNETQINAHNQTVVHLHDKSKANLLDKSKGLIAGKEVTCEVHSENAKAIMVNLIKENGIDANKTAKDSNDIPQQPNTDNDDNIDIDEEYNHGEDVTKVVIDIENSEQPENDLDVSSDDESSPASSFSQVYGSLGLTLLSIIAFIL